MEKEIMERSGPWSVFIYSKQWDTSRNRERAWKKVGIFLEPSCVFTFMLYLSLISTHDIWDNVRRRKIIVRSKGKIRCFDLKVLELLKMRIFNIKSSIWPLKRPFSFAPCDPINKGLQEEDLASRQPPCLLMRFCPKLKEEILNVWNFSLIWKKLLTQFALLSYFANYLNLW